eukprot:COSAG01_NODE_6648_length_3564_cov_11.164791_6_plen_153_part_00
MLLPGGGGRRTVLGPPRTVARSQVAARLLPRCTLLQRAAAIDRVDHRMPAHHGHHRPHPPPALHAPPLRRHVAQTCAPCPQPSLWCNSTDACRCLVAASGLQHHTRWRWSTTQRSTYYTWRSTYYVALLAAAARRRRLRWLQPYRMLRAVYR